MDQLVLNGDEDRPFLPEETHQAILNDSPTNELLIPKRQELQKFAPLITGLRPRVAQNFSYHFSPRFQGSKQHDEVRTFYALQ